MLSHVWLFVTLRTVAHDTLLSMGFPGRNIRVGCYFLLQGSFQPRDQTRVSRVSCIGRKIFYHWATWKAHESRGLEHFAFCASLVLSTSMATKQALNQYLPNQWVNEACQWDTLAWCSELENKAGEGTGAGFIPRCPALPCAQLLPAGHAGVSLHFLHH